MTFRLLTFRPFQFVLITFRLLTFRPFQFVLITFRLITFRPFTIRPNFISSFYVSSYLYFILYLIALLRPISIVIEK
jgi:hypothetical protein